MHRPPYRRVVVTLFSQLLLSPDRYTDTGLLELEVQFVGIGKFAEAKKNEGTPPQTVV